MSLADFETPLSYTIKSGPVNSIPASTKSQAWQDIKHGLEHHEDSQQRHFHPHQPKKTAKQHQYPTQSKSTRSTNTAQTDDNGEPTKFVYLRDDGERPTHVWNLFCCIQEL